MKYKWLYFTISLLILIPGTVSLVRYGLRLSLDFTGGTLLEFSTVQKVTPDQIRQTAVEAKIELSQIQSAGDTVYLLRAKPISQELVEKFKSDLTKISGPVTEKRFETVGPTIGAELSRKAVLAVIVASVCIIIYIAWSFRHIPRPYSSWKFGLAAVAALLHDALVVVGLFSLFGHFFHVEIDSLFVTALLTVIGFSVHDTIVVFDRIRENLPKLPSATFEQVVDFSLTETLGRSLNTSLTVLLTLSALLLFGSETTRWFITALLIGIASGTYSSIFNAAPLLVLWESRK